MRLAGESQQSYWKTMAERYGRVRDPLNAQLCSLQAYLEWRGGSLCVPVPILYISVSVSGLKPPK